MTAEAWYRTPGGIMRQGDPIEHPEPGHWFTDQDQRSHAYPDRLTRKTRPPTWAKRQTIGELAAEARKKSKVSARNPLTRQASTR